MSTILTNFHSNMTKIERLYWRRDRRDPVEPLRGINENGEDVDKVYAEVFVERRQGIQIA